MGLKTLLVKRWMMSPNLFCSFNKTRALFFRSFFPGNRTTGSQGPTGSTGQTVRGPEVDFRRDPGREYRCPSSTPFFLSQTTDTGKHSLFV